MRIASKSKTKKVIVISVALILITVLSIALKWIKTGNLLGGETIMFGIIICLLALTNGYLGYVFLGVASKKAPGEIIRNVISSFLTFALLTFIVSLIVISICTYVYYLIKGYDTSDFITHLFAVELKSATMQFGIWILVGSSLFFYIIWRSAIKREQQLSEENLKYKYKMLKSQVNPHFLFNSLNTLSEIIYQDTHQADKFIQKLSGIYRYILENEDVDLVPLPNELEFVKQYFALQKERDHEKIRLYINCPSEEGFRVVPISMQSLVENALKHNSRSEEDPLVIQMSYDRDCIVISNPIRRKNTLNIGLHTGLKNLKERVRLITGNELLIHEKEEHFIVKLPLVKSE